MRLPPGSGGPLAIARAGAGSGGATAEAARSRGTIRSGARTALPSLSAAAGERGSPAADDHAPHHLGRLVDRSDDAGTERLVCRIHRRATGSITGTGGAICRLCRVAAGVVEWRGPGEAVGILEGEAGRRSDIGVADGPATTGDSQLQGSGDEL